MLGLGCVLAAIYYYLGTKQWLAIFLVFCMITAGFQLVPVDWMLLPSAGITKPYDWMWVFFGAVILFRPQVLLDFPLWRNFKWLAIFLLILIVLLVYSIVWKEIEVKVVVRVFRNFLFFMSIFLFMQLSLTEMQKIFRLVIYVTSFACVIYCLQSVVHTGLLNKVTNDMSQESMGMQTTRYYNVPVFICPVIFFLFFPKEAFGLKYRFPQLAICSMAILLTQHRNLMVSVMLCFFLYLVISKQVKPVTAILSCLVGVVLLMMADTYLDNRLTKGMEDLDKASASNKRRVIFHDIALSDLTTTEFRQLLFKERLAYILKDEERSVFGIGLMADDSKKAGALRFNIGIPDDDGNVSQIANIDIAWAPLLLQLGLSGTITFLLVHLALLLRFFKRRNNPYLCVGIFLIVSLLISSLYGSMIAMPYTMCIVMLFAAYYFKIINPATYTYHLWQPSISR